MTLATDIILAIERYCNIKVVPTTTVEYFGNWESGLDELIVSVGPISSIVSLYDLHASSTVDASSLDFEATRGCVFKLAGDNFLPGRKRYRLTYMAGYATTPADLQRAADMWASHLTLDPTGALKSYSTGDDSETYMDVTYIPPMVAGMLAPFRRIVV